MATTSVAIASRGAAYLAASSSIIAPTLRTPSQSFSTSTAISSGASTRSGARITQTCRVSSNFNFACRGSTGRLVSLTLMLRGPAIASALTSRSLARRSLARLGHEGARRYMAIDIGMVKGIELDPQHVGLEDQRVAHRFALGRGPGMLLDVFEREAGIARRLLQAAAEIAHDIGIDEVVMLQHPADALFVQVGRKQLGQRGGDRFQRRLVAAEMHIGFHRKACRRQDAFGRFHIGAVEPEPLGQFEPALDAALTAGIAVVVLDPVPPFLPDAAVAKARDHDRILDRDRALVIVAVERPGLHLALVQFAAVQEAMERMQAVIARGADLAQRRLQLAGIVERDALAERIGRHVLVFRALVFHALAGYGVQSTISVPSVANCQPARSASSRSGDAGSSAGLELLICRNTFWPISRPSRAAMAPRSPDIAICPMPCPVLLPRPAVISSSSRHTVPSKNTSGAPASRAFSSSLTPAQAAMK